jgi:hypothetical protein
MQYFLSSLSENESEIQEETDRLFDLIIKNIVAQKSQCEPFLFIINDIDHDKVRNRYDELVYKGAAAGFQTRYTKRHFVCRNYNDNSLKYPRDVNRFNVPNRSSYKTALKCTSAQLILEVR